MRVHRRDVLKTVAASVVAVATYPLAGCALGAAANRTDRIAKGSATTMNSRPLMTVRFIAAPTQNIGTAPHGVRTVVPVTGGEFEGPRLRGKVLGGGDWLL